MLADWSLSLDSEASLQFPMPIVEEVVEFVVDVEDFSGGVVQMLG